MELKSIYLDPATDDAIAARAEALGMSRAQAFRRTLKEGMQAVRAGHARPPLPTDAPVMNLRTLYLEEKVFDKLRVEAFDRRVGWSRVMLEYLAMGLEMARAEGEAGGP